MILGIHIIIALVSLVFSSIALFSPTNIKQRISYILAGGTLASGVALVISDPATMARACVVGIVYFIAVSVIIYHTKTKLILQSQKIK